MDDLTQNLKEHVLKSNKLDEVRFNLRNYCEILDSEVAALKTKISILEIENQNLVSKVQKVHFNEEEIQIAKKKCLELEATTVELRTQLDGKNARLTTLKQELLELQGSHENLASRSRLSAEHALSLAEQNFAIEMKLVQRESELNKVAEQYVKIEEELAQFEVKSEALTLEHQQQIQSKTVLEKELELKSKFISDLGQQISAFESHIQTLNNKISANEKRFTNELLKSEEQNLQFEEMNNYLRSLNESTGKELTQLREQQGILNSEREQLVYAIDLNQSRIMELENLHAVKVEQVNDLENKLSNSSNEVEALKKHLVMIEDTAKEQLAKLQVEWADLDAQKNLDCQFYENKVSQLLSEYQLLESSQSETSVTYEAELNAFRTQIFELNAALEHMAHTNQQLRVSQRKAQEESENLLVRNHSLAKECQHLTEKFDDLFLITNQTSDQTATLVNQLRSEVSELANKLANKTEELEVVQGEKAKIIEESQIDIPFLKLQVSDRENKIIALQSEFSQVSSELTAAKKDLGSQSLNLYNELARTKELEWVVKKQSAELEELKNTYNTDKLETLKVVDRLQLVEAQLLRERNNHDEELKMTTENFNEFKANAAKAECLMIADFESFKQQINGLNAENKRLDFELKSAQKSNAEKTERIQQIADENNLKMEQLKGDFDIKISFMSKEFSNDAQQKVAVLEVKVDTLISEISELQTQLNDAGKTTSDLECRNQLTLQKFQDRERELKGYYSFVSSEKESYKRAVVKLVREIEYAKTIHPLNDYLNFTDREIFKIECELKKTPVISPNRAHFEKVIEQLMGQRKFISDLILKSEASLNESKGKAEALLKGILASPLPPPEETNLKQVFHF